MPNKKRTKAPQWGAYLFKDKEPVIDMTRTLLETIYGRRVDYKMLREIEKQGGASVGAMAGWFFGDTRQPKNATIEATGRALGHERVWVKMKKGK